MNVTLTADQIEALRQEGRVAYARGISNAPMVGSPTYREVITGLPVGTDGPRLAATEFERGWGEAARCQHELDACREMGLTALAESLTVAGITTDVENTGGYCMALTVAVADGTVWVITSEDAEEENYTVARYSDAAWTSGDSEDPSTLDTEQTMPKVLDLLTFARPGTAF